MIPTQTLREILRKFRNSPPIGGEIPGNSPTGGLSKANFAPKPFPSISGPDPLFARFRIHSRSQTGTKTSVKTLFLGGVEMSQGIRGQEFWLQVLVDVKVEIFILVS